MHWCCRSSSQMRTDSCILIYLLFFINSGNPWYKLIELCSGQRILNTPGTMCKRWVQFLGKVLVKFSLNCWANKVAVYSLGSLVLCAAPVTHGLGRLRRDSLKRGPQPARDLPRWVNRKRWVGMFLQPPCLLVPQAPNLGCLSCSVWAFLSVPRLRPLLCCSPAGTKGRVRDTPLVCADCRSLNCSWGWQGPGDKSLCVCQPLWCALQKVCWDCWCSPLRAGETPQAEHLRWEEGPELPCRDASGLQLTQEQNIGHVRDLLAEVYLLGVVLKTVTLSSSTQTSPSPLWTLDPFV